MPVLFCITRKIRPVLILEKAVQHKYLRKYKKGNRWRYVYPSKGSRHGDDHHVSAHKAIGKDEEIHAGASFSAGVGKGHLVVESVKDGKVSFHHDDVDGKGTKGRIETVSLGEFKQRLKDAHADAHKAHAEAGLERRKELLEKAKKHGTEKHVSRAKKEVDRWQDKHKEHLPQASQKSHAETQAALAKDREAMAKKAKERREAEKAKGSPRLQALQLAERMGWNREQIDAYMGGASIKDVEGMGKPKKEEPPAKKADKPKAKKAEKKPDKPKKEKPKAPAKAPHEMSKDEYVSHRKAETVKHLQEEIDNKQHVVDRAEGPDDILAQFAKQHIAQNKARISEINNGFHDLIFGHEHEELKQKQK